MGDLVAPGKRLSHLIDKILKIRPIRFVEQIGINPAYLSQMRGGRKPFTASVACKIGLEYPRVNADWILTGEGEPVKITGSNHPTHAESLPQVNEPPADYCTAERISCDDVPGFVRCLLNGVKALRGMVGTMQKELQIIQNHGIESAE